MIPPPLGTTRRTATRKRRGTLEQSSQETSGGRGGGVDERTTRTALVDSAVAGRCRPFDGEKRERRRGCGEKAATMSIIRRTEFLKCRP